MTGPTRDRHHDAHQAAMAHVDACEAARWAEETGEYEGDTPPVMPVTAGPYCACDTCDVRETLAAAWPHALAYAADLVAAADAASALGGSYHTAEELLRQAARRETLLGHEVPA